MPSSRLFMPKPNPKQHLALTDRHRYVGYGGARGGGKSWFVRWKAILLCLRYPGIKVLITRRTYRELLNNHIVPLQALLSGIACYHNTDKCFRFPNGSAIWFGYCAADSDLGQYQGAEYDVWFADEAGQFREEWLTQIDACIRGVNPFPKRTYFTLNPGGPGHSYFKRLFIDRRYTEDEHPEDYSFIQALCTDNQALLESQPQYLRALEKLPPRLREAWLYGRWDVYEGQFFEEFRSRPDAAACAAAGISQEQAAKEGRFTHVIAPLDLSTGPRKHWQILRSYDFGYAKPFSCAWWACDHDGVLYRILELYGCTDTPDQGVKWTPDKQFSEIARLEREHPWLKGKQIHGVADPAIWDSSRGESIADTAMKHGIFFTPGDHQRLPGWMQCHYRLQFDGEGYPRCYIFSTCKHFLRTVPMLTYDPQRPEDLDTSQEDHIADEWRYLCMSRPIAPLLPSPTAPIIQNPLSP